MFVCKYRFFSVLFMSVIARTTAASAAAVVSVSISRPSLSAVVGGRWRSPAVVSGRQRPSVVVSDRQLSAVVDGGHQRSSAFVGGRRLSATVGGDCRRLPATVVRGGHRWSATAVIWSA